MPLIALAALAIAALALPPSNHANAQATSDDPDKRCLQCHGQPHIAELTPEERISMVGTYLGTEPQQPTDQTPDPDQETTSGEPTTRPGLYVEQGAFLDTAHPDTRCIDCHEDATQLPHPPKLSPGTCSTSCHEDVVRSFYQGAHQTHADYGKNATPTCATCHGGHDIAPISTRSAAPHRLNSLYLCGDCHAHHKHADDQADPADRVSAYLESTHALAVTRAGLLFAATCADCHDAHAVLPAADPRSMVHRNRVPETCGQCHAGINEIYETSIHGQLLAKGDENAPVCTDCHTAHAISRASSPRFMLDVIGDCGQCHDSPDRNGDRLGTYYKSYRASYHGQVTNLGSTRAARCSDCHGAHDILPLDHPDSRVGPERLVETCAQKRCHPGANGNFAKFDPHANYRDRKNYPVLFGVWLYFVILMSTVFTFFGLHTLLWFLRSIAERVKHGPPPEHQHPKTAIRRFTKLNRVNHILVIITFFGLTATGIPLIFAHQDWALKLATLFGGVDAAGLWHRVFATMLILNFVLHFIGLARAFHRRPGTWSQWIFGPDSMLPKWRDITDCLAMLRWFIIGGRKPPFDRWAYWEKFDYWAEIGGSMIIGGSGFLLWFPVLASKLLPGTVFNIAMIIHGYEALLAICFIFTIHFFNAHIRPGTFPVDEVIFTGSLPEFELEETRPDEYRRLVESGRLEQLRVPAPDPTLHPRLVLVAIVAVSIGLLLVTLIIAGGLQLI